MVCTHVAAPRVVRSKLIPTAIPPHISYRRATESTVFKSCPGTPLPGPLNPLPRLKRRSGSSFTVSGSEESLSTGEAVVTIRPKSTSWPSVLNIVRICGMVNRDRLRSLLLLGKHTLDVDLNDLLLFNEELGQLLMERPGECIPLVSPQLL